MPVSSRYGIDYPLGTELPDIDGDILKVVNGIESLAAQFGQGTLAARPVSTPGSPGKQGRFYVVNSGAELGQLFYDYGTGWLHLNPDQTPGANSITSAMIQDNAVGASEIADGSVGAAEIADGIITAAKLVSALKPSEGAGGGTEALRALGTGVANAAAGNDARFAAATPADGSVTTPKLAANAVTPAKVALDAAQTYNFLGVLQHKGMKVHRHPYGTDRHVESGVYGRSNVTNDTLFADYPTFTDAFAVAPAVVNCISSSAQNVFGGHGNTTSFVDDVSTVGFTSYVYGGSVGSWDAQISWIAEGQD